MYMYPHTYRGFARPCVRKSSKKCSAKAAPPTPPLPPGRRRRVPPSFSSPPGLCRECMQFSLARACALLRCTLRFQHRPTRREIGNLKSKLRTAARRCRAHPRPHPSFSRITLDHRWSSRAWHRGCVIELGKWNDFAYRAFFVPKTRDSRPFFICIFFFIFSTKIICTVCHKS